MMTTISLSACVLRPALISSLFLIHAFGQMSPNFSLSMSSPSVFVAAGGNATVKSVVSVASGYGQPIYLMPSALPAGVSVIIPSPVAGGQTVTMKLNASTAVKEGTFQVTVYASSCGETHSESFSVTVLPPQPPSPVLPQKDTTALIQGVPFWVASWGASAVTPSNDSGAYYLTNVTVRQIAHLSIGTASGLRIRLSNALGKEAVSFGAVHVAQWAGDSAHVTSAILPATDRIVTFGGSRTVAIAPGADVFGDPVSLALPPGANLAVSFYIPKTSNVPATMHTLGGQTAYFALGDSTVVIPNAVTDSVRPYLTGVDVDAPGASAVVALGDSITDGMLSSPNLNLRWPDDLARRLQAAGNVVGVVNEGVAGNCVVVNCLGPSALARFTRDVLTVSGVKYLIVLEGVNDVGNAPTLTASQLGAAYRTMVALAHARGILVFGATITPFGGSNYATTAHEQLRQQINAFIRTGGAFDGVIDFDKAIANPASPAHILPQYDGDHIHPNDAGYQAMANAIDLALLNLAPELTGR